MNFLFVHQNFPGQYVHLARHLASDAQHRVVALGQRKDRLLPGIDLRSYLPARAVTPRLHHYLRSTETGVLNAQAVAREALALRRSGFKPDVMLGHNGWGEIWYLKDVFPDVPLIEYFEYFYRMAGGDVGFEPDAVPSFDTGPRVRTKNLGNLIGLDACDLGQCPTRWQRSRYPERQRAMLRVIHDGVDSDVVCPDTDASLMLSNQRTGEPLELRAGDEVVTYVARNLEPYRGFPTFMRSLPEVLAQKPQAHVVIVGGDGVSYGTGPREAASWRQQLLAELGDTLDLRRVHFLGRVPYTTFLRVLQVSAVHVYLTYPFVLSWSMLEAMAAGCLVLGSDTPPVREVIRDGYNGRLVDFFDPAALAAAVCEALAKPARSVELRRHARQTVIERYDLKRVCLPAQLALLRECTG